jgi:hypothetical protein
MKNVYVGVAIAAMFAMPAKADEVLKYHFFTHSTKLQAEDVGDVEGHVLGFARLSGQILLSDGSVGTIFWTVGFDFTKGDGPATSYMGPLFGGNRSGQWRTTRPSRSSA